MAQLRHGEKLNTICGGENSLPQYIADEIQLFKKKYVKIIYITIRLYLMKKEIQYSKNNIDK